MRVPLYRAMTGFSPGIQKPSPRAKSTPMTTQAILLPLGSQKDYEESINDMTSFVDLQGSRRIRCSVHARWDLRRRGCDVV